MAVVFLAEDRKHRRPVAIKLLQPEVSAAVGSERFLREIAIAGNLQHPHILPLYDSGKAGGLFFYVMPFVEGESLRERLEREPQLPIEDALRVAREVGGALQYAHERGVVHRDIKPENILLSGGHALVADFGIARALQAAGAETVTATGVMLGTPHYMSPEQATGGAVDGRTDQYSLACTLYEMLIGQPPFTGASTQIVLARHSLDTVPGVRVARATVPPEVEAAIVRAMAKLPADRFPTMREFLEALGGAGRATGEAAAVGAPARTTSGAGRRWAIRLAIVVLGSYSGVFAARLLSGWISAPAVRALAVLPFENVASGPDSSFLAEGMTDGLISDLAEIRSLKIISRASGTAAREKGASPDLLASKLGVGAVVEGSIERSRDSVRVAVRCFRVPSGKALFAQEYRRSLDELPDLQRGMAIAIAHSLHARLEAHERTRLTASGHVDQRAYEAYLRGRFHLERDELEQARALFEQATKIAPDWAAPYVGLANYYSALPFSSDVPPAEVLPKARAALAQALQLDETLAEAHAANAYIRAYYEWDWRAAEQEFRRALELRPNYADAYFSYSRFLASRRRLDESIAQLGRAVELDPLSGGLVTNRALLDYFAGRYEAAAGQLRRILAKDSTDALARWGLALVLEQQGQPEQAIALLEPISSNSLNRKASLGHAYGAAGKTSQAKRVLDELTAAAGKSYVPSYYFALLHLALGDKSQALRDLERAYEERSTVLAYVRIDPRLAPLRSEPRFTALVSRLGGD